jgi:hypothetical protein
VELGAMELGAKGIGPILEVLVAEILDHVQGS